jgi:integrase
VAYIRKLPSGNFNAIVRHPSGKRLSKTDARKGVVAAWAAEQEAAYRVGASAAYRSRALTFDAWASKWWAARAVEASTARKDEAALRIHLRPYWGTWPLSTIGRMDVQAWVNERHRAGVGADALRTAKALLASILGEAVLEGHLLASPVSRIKMPRRSKPIPRWFTRDEYERIQLALEMRTLGAGRHAARRPDPHIPTWRALVGLACWTGLRPSELAGLDVRHLDLDRGMVYVEQVWTRERTLRNYGKSDNAHRWVPFPPEVAELLWQVVADKRPTDPALAMPQGGRLGFEGNVRNYVWVPTLRAAGIEPVRFYTCRHTFASWAVQSGMKDRKIIRYLGHADAHLVDVYAHLNEDEHDEIRAMWGKAPAPQTTHAPRAAPKLGDVTAGQSADEWGS